MVTKMLQKHGRIVDEFNENFNKEIKNTKLDMENIVGIQSEMKNTISEMTGILERINRVDKVEDRITDIENGVVEDTQSEQQQEVRIQKNKDNFRSLWENIMHNNIRIIGVPEGEERGQEIENLFEEFMMENFPNVVKNINIQPKEVQRAPNKMNLNRPTPRHIII